jgi:hypothetical protein
MRDDVTCRYLDVKGLLYMVGVLQPSPRGRTCNVSSVACAKVQDTPVMPELSFRSPTI